MFNGIAVWLAALAARKGFASALAVLPYVPAAVTGIVFAVAMAVAYFHGDATSRVALFCVAGSEAVMGAILAFFIDGKIDRVASFFGFKV